MIKLPLKRLLTLIYGTGFVFILLSGWLWWNRIETNPQRAFWSMVNQSMATSSTTIGATQTQNGEILHQTTQFTTGKAAFAHATVHLQQGNTDIRTEKLGTKTIDYNRYDTIVTDQLNAAGKKLNTSSLIGVWSKSSDVKQSSVTAAGQQLLAQATLGVGLPLGSVPVPIADLSAEERGKMFNLIQGSQVYQIDFAHVAKTRQDGRLLYTYNVSMQPILYVRMMKQFGKELQMTELNQVDPNSYSDSDVLKLKLTIDVHSHQLATVGFDNSTYEQHYSGYGLPMDMTLPTKAISAAELQKRLQAL
jgi:hypothetical protein